MRGCRATLPAEAVRQHGSLITHTNMHLRALPKRSKTPRQPGPAGRPPGERSRTFRAPGDTSSDCRKPLKFNSREGWPTHALNGAPLGWRRPAQRTYGSSHTSPGCLHSACSHIAAQMAMKSSNIKCKSSSARCWLLQCGHVRAPPLSDGVGSAGGASIVVRPCLGLFHNTSAVAGAQVSGGAALGNGRCVCRLRLPSPHRPFRRPSGCTAQPKPARERGPAGRLLRLATMPGPAQCSSGPTQTGAAHHVVKAANRFPTPGAHATHCSHALFTSRLRAYRTWPTQCGSKPTASISCATSAWCSAGPANMRVRRCPVTSAPSGWDMCSTPTAQQGLRWEAEGQAVEESNHRRWGRAAGHVAKQPSCSKHPRLAQPSLRQGQACPLLAPVLKALYTNDSARRGQA